MRANIRVLIVAIMLTNVLIYGQDFKKDFLAMSEKTYNAKRMNFTLHYNLYLDNDFSIPYEQREIKVARSYPYNLTFKESSSEYIANKEGSVLVSHDLKRIVLKPQSADNYSGTQILNAIEINFDTLMMLCQKVNYKKLGTEEIEYECHMKAGIYSKIKMVFNLNTKTPVKTQYYHRLPIKKNNSDSKWHTVMVEVIYKSLNFEPVAHNEQFAYSKYVRKVNNKYVLTGRYSNYEFINLFDENNYDIEK